MRNIIYSTLVLLVTSMSICSAQMHDANWIYSYPIGDSMYIWNFSPIKDTFIVKEGIKKYIVSSFSTSKGELICYSDGASIFNTDNEIIENGDSLEYQPNWNLQQLLFSESGEFSGEFLPWPGKEDSLVVYIEKIHYNSIFDPSTDYHRELWYSIIDLQANNGKGKVISKANFLQDSIYHFVSVQHGNGRDWWIVAYDWYRSKVTIFYFGQDGIMKSHQEEFPLMHYIEHDVSAPLVVSGLGDWIFKSFRFKDGYLFQFDRCNGELTYAKTIAIPDSLPPNQPINIGFQYCVSSPQGKYLYGFLHYVEKVNGTFIDNYSLLQANVSLPNASFQFITAPNALLEWFPFPQTDPLGKIRFTGQDYIVNKTILGTIHRPDNLLDECGLELPTTSGIPADFRPFITPRFPYYRMGRLEGSECDTLISSIPTGHPDQGTFLVTPNPATHVITVESSQLKAGKAETQLQIVDVMGREVQQQRIMTNAIQQEVDISTLEKGIYFIRLIQANQILGVARFVKIE